MRKMQKDVIFTFIASSFKVLVNAFSTFSPKNKKKDLISLYISTFW